MSDLSDYKTIQRKSKIDCIVKSIINCWEEAKQTFQFPEKEKMLVEIMAEFGVTDRKAKEYLEIALAIVNGEISHDGLILHKSVEEERKKLLQKEDERPNNT